MKQQQQVVVVVAFVLCFFTLLTLFQILPSSSSSTTSTHHENNEEESIAENNKKTIATSTRHQQKQNQNNHELVIKQEQQQHSSGDLLFTIVVLTYKAPKSLSETLKSLAKTNIINHPKLKQIIVYFQAFDVKNDRKLVRDLVDEFYAEKKSQIHIINSDNENDEEEKSSFVRVTGRVENLPVAKATFTALSYVTTPLVMYLECDRPAYEYNKHNKLSSTSLSAQLFAKSLIDTAIRYVTSKKADVFRLQIYANSELSKQQSVFPLPRVTYGEGPLKEKCDRSPFLSKKECQHAKQLGKTNRVFYTAYCKHWTKLLNEKEQPQQDLCDSVCFPEWEKMLMRNNTFAAVADDKYRVVRDKFKSAITDVHHHDDNTDNDDNDNDNVICTDSEWCNWTNQPTMYLKSWYEDNIKAPCLASPKGCVGVPGRKSAVLQEIFFVKNRAAWRSRKHKICLHRQGLFYHFEIDNRE